jgi:hypothetical protein
VMGALCDHQTSSTPIGAMLSIVLLMYACLTEKGPILPSGLTFGPTSVNRGYITVMS